MIADKLGKKGITFLSLEKHLQEQVAYRESKCQDCLAAGKCQSCSCSVPNKWFAKYACSGKRYPDMMDAKTWEAYKLEHNIKVDLDVQTNENI